MEVTEERRKELDDMADQVIDLTLQAYLAMRQAGATLEQAHEFLVRSMDKTRDMIRDGILKGQSSPDNERNENDKESSSKESSSKENGS